MSARVLVVDDQAANIRLLEAKLTAEYFDVITAESGEAALRQARDESPDIILLDVMMPKMDGFEVCKRLKADSQTAHIPVIIITALSEPRDRVRGLEAGADDFITKPVTDLALLSRVKSLVRLKMITDELRLREATGEYFGAINSDPTLSEQDAEGGRLLLVEQAAESIETITEIAKQAGHAVVLASAGDEALERALADEVDLILVSRTLTGEDPLRICSRIRSHSQLRHTPILLVIEDGDNEFLAKGLELGVNDYITRPIDPHELLARVRTQVRRKRYQDLLRSNYLHSLSLALIDGLTGLYNRRYFDTHLEAELGRAARSGKPMTLLMIDLDFFKSVNDTHGHSAGDDVLREIARRISRDVRNFDTVARMGGEEFVVVMPDTGADVAASVAERLRSTIAESSVAVPSSPDLRLQITASIGIAVATQPMTVAEILSSADDALYAAKHGGRNQVYQVLDRRKPALSKAASA